MSDDMEVMRGSGNVFADFGDADADAEAKKIFSAHPSLLKAADAGGSTALHHAAGFGTPATMRALLAAGADANAANLDLANIARLQEHGRFAGKPDPGRSAGEDQITRFERDDL